MNSLEIWALVLVLTVLLNVVPAFMPPTWALLAYFRINDGLDVWALAMMGQIDDLERVTTKMLTLDPSRAEGLFCRAEVAIHRERDADAIADYTRAIAANPEFALAYLGRSDAHANLGNTAEADEDYARAVELDPHLADDDPPEDEEEG